MRGASAVVSMNLSMVERRPSTTTEATSRTLKIPTRAKANTLRSAKETPLVDAEDLIQTGLDFGEHLCSLSIARKRRSLRPTKSAAASI